MKRITATDTLELSLSESIQLVEDIWDTIAVEAEPIELSEEEKKIIDDRLETYHKNPDAGLSWNEVHTKLTGQA